MAKKESLSFLQKISKVWSKSTKQGSMIPPESKTSAAPLESDHSLDELTQQVLQISKSVYFRKRSTDTSTKPNTPASSSSPKKSSSNKP